MYLQGVVGPQSQQSLPVGTPGMLRLGQLNDTIVTELHGKYYEQAYRGNLYSTGTTALLAINNATYTVATTGATATPLIGILNPSGSQVNAVILEAYLGVTITALAATGGGPFCWMVTAAAGPISTGNTPWSCKTLAQAGSACKGLSNVALTGMTGTLAIFRGSALAGGSGSNASFTATAVAMQTPLMASTEQIQGSIIVPPNAALVLMATTTPVAHSVAGGLIWEEVPI